jgi:hypothetical protein
MSFLTTPTLSASGKYVTLSGGMPILASGYFTNGLFYNGLTARNDDTQTSVASAKDDGTFYIYFSGGNIIPANGLLVPLSIEYSDPIGHNYFVNGVKDNSFTSLVPVTAYNSWNYPNLAYTGYSPTDTSINYFTVSGGVAKRAKGVYSTGYYYDSGNTNDYVRNGELVTDYTQAIPQQAKDNGLYYTFLNGVPTLADGSINGVIYTQGQISSLSPIFSGNSYVINNNGEISLANGLYSTGKYASGAIVSGPSLSSYIGQAIDDNKYYVVYSGLSTSNATYSAVALANGLYDNFAFTSGQVNFGYTNLLPQRVKTSASQVNQNAFTTKLYTYNSGVAYLANGFYSIGNYVSGNLSSSVSLCAQPVLDNNNFYDNLNGKTFLSEGYYGENKFYSKGVRVYPEYNLLQSGSSVSIYVTKKPYRHPDTKNYLYTYQVSAGLSSAPIRSNLADGPYSNGFFVSGLQRGSDVFPVRAKDNNLFYSQKAGAWKLTTDFSIYGFISAGVVLNTPISAVRYPVDGKGLAYDYSGNVPRLANGVYDSVSANGIFKNGVPASLSALSNTSIVSAPGTSGLITVDLEKATAGLPYIITAGNSTLLSSAADFEPYLSELSAMGCIPDLITTSLLSAKLSGGKIDLLNDGLYTQGRKISPSELPFLFLLGYSKAKRLIRFDRGVSRIYSTTGSVGASYSIGLYRGDKFMIVRQLGVSSILTQNEKIIRLATIQ